MVNDGLCLNNSPLKLFTSNLYELSMHFTVASAVHEKKSKIVLISGYAVEMRDGIESTNSFTYYLDIKRTKKQCTCVLMTYKQFT